MVEKWPIVLILAAPHEVGLVGLLFGLVLLDVWTHTLSRFAIKLVYDVPIIDYIEWHLRSPKPVELSVLLLTCQNPFVEELVVLTRIEGVVLNVRVVRLVVLVFHRFKLFLLINSLVVIDEHRVDLIAHFLRFLDRPSDDLTETHAQIVEFIVLEVLRVVHER